LKLIVLLPLSQFASLIAARSVQRPWLSAQMPSPLLTSTVVGGAIDSEGEIGRDGSSRLVRGRRNRSRVR